MFTKNRRNSKRVPFKVRHYASISENFDHSSAAEGIVINALFLLTIGCIAWWFFDGTFSLVTFLLFGTLALGLILLFIQIFQLIKSMWKQRKVRNET